MQGIHVAVNKRNSQSIGVEKCFDGLEANARCSSLDDESAKVNFLLINQ